MTIERLEAGEVERFDYEQPPNTELRKVWGDGVYHYELRPAGYRTEGWMSEAELRWLAEVAQHMGSIVELGCWKGRSTCALAGACKGPVYAVDHWRGSADERATTHQEATRRDIIVDFRANTRHLANVVMVVGDVAGREVYSLFDDESTEPDMVFVDAGHTEAEVGQQIHVWWKRTGRVIVGHDFNWPGVRDAVMRYFGCDPSGVSVYQGAGSLWCALKPGVSPEQIGAHVIA